ncbi:MAG: peptidoglycan-binding domain-containing protein [Hyphomicrobiaceae bacterium]|nr:peptidoglycan-binding domain-containing protein [Hyphomicrobiaceae bacterium]
MRSVTGFVLLFTGLGVGAYAYYPETVERHVHLARVTRILSPVPTTSGVAPVEASRSFSPATSWFDTGAAPAEVTTVVNGRLPAGQPELLRPASAWQTVVIPSRPKSAGVQPLTTTAPVDPSARTALVRELQRELRRAGCYHGEIDSDWGVATRRALADFLRRVNAALPTEVPDYFQLALLQSHPSDTCSSGSQVAAGAAAPTSAYPLPAPAPRVARRAPLDGDGSLRSADDVSPPAPVLAARPALPGRMAVGARPGPDYDGRLSPAPAGAPLSGGPQFAAPSEERAARRVRARDDVPGARGTAKRAANRQIANRSKAARQRALMRQAFGDAFY